MHGCPQTYQTMHLTPTKEIKKCQTAFTGTSTNIRSAHHQNPYWLFQLNAHTASRQHKYFALLMHFQSMIWLCQSRIKKLKQWPKKIYKKWFWNFCSNSHRWRQRLLSTQYEMNFFFVLMWKTQKRLQFNFSQMPR